MASKYTIKARDPVKVKALREVIDAAYFGEVDVLKQLIAQPLPNFGSPQSPKEWARAASAPTEKDMTFRANAAAATSRAIESQIRVCLSIMDAAPGLEIDEKDDGEDKREQKLRDVIAAVRGQMDPNRIRELEREVGEPLEDEPE